ncbi:unnamed protein product [Mytilus coruscus]|uniref:Uncharacterized protein n=1 Tax=Mytilus coruscus TaxID=42192 RepID=A0A6J8AS93_MYTCO|nr:unnamed protein product [Mytilus coruscus]
MSNPDIVMPQPQLSRVAPARKEKEPDIFNGSKTEWVDYIVHFEQAATWNRWSDSEKAQQLSLCLRGSAQKILSDLTLGQLSDYTSIKSPLAQRYHPRESEVAYRCEFRNLKRQKGETVADYGYIRSAQKTYPALKCSDIEPTVIDQYIHGLNNHELKKHVQFHHPQTFIQAIAFASEFEAFLGSSDRIFKPEGTDTEQSDFTLQTLTSHSRWYCFRHKRKDRYYKLKIGKLCLDQEFIVAKIDKRSGILGMNFLSKHDAEIHIGKEVLIIKGEKIKFKTEISKVCAKVRLTDKVFIPPNRELLVESFIDGHIDNESGLVESTDFVK